MTLTQQEMDEALAVAIAKLEADNTALTAQNEALRTALFAVIDQIERDVENSLNPYGPTAAQAREALSLTPAEALERAKRDAEERQRAEAFITGVRLDLGYYGRSTTPLGFAIGERLDGFDNFRKGAGR